MSGSDDERGHGFVQALRTPEYWLLAVAGVASAAGISGWVTVPCVMTGLLASAMPKYIVLWPQARDLKQQREWWRTVSLSVFDAMLAAMAVHVLGQVVHWMLS